MFVVFSETPEMGLKARPPLTRRRKRARFRREVGLQPERLLPLRDSTGLQPVFPIVRSASGRLAHLHLAIQLLKKYTIGF
jgi:hypothetical protein